MSLHIDKINKNIIHSYHIYLHHMSRIMRKPDLGICKKTKAQISCAVTAQLISAFVFATSIVHFLLYLYPKFQASNLLCCTGLFVSDLVRTTPRLIFGVVAHMCLQRGAYNSYWFRSISPKYILNQATALASRL